MVVPSRQRAHALWLAHAAARLAEGRRVWTSPDVLPLEGWLGREIERHAVNNSRVPRVLSAAEEWLLWRQCTVDATGDLDLVNRASLAESLRHASTLGADLGIDPQTIREPAGTEAALLVAVHRAVMQRCHALGAAPVSAALATLPCVGDERPVAFAGFLAPSPRLRSIVDARAQRGFESSYAPPIEPPTPVPTRVVTPADEAEELEQIAAWCQQRLSARADARLLILVPGSEIGRASCRERV